jgi:hypothetical protein
MRSVKSSEVEIISFLTIQTKTKSQLRMTLQKTKQL